MSEYRDLPIRRSNQLYVTEFHYMGGIFPQEWKNYNDAFINTNESVLKAVQPGELIYQGSDLHELDLLSDEDNSDYAIVIKCVGTLNMKFTIRGRRQDANNNIGLKIDAEANTIAFTETINGTESTIAQENHTFRTTGYNYYTFELWMQDEYLLGFINDFNIIRTTSDYFSSEPGFSLYIPEVESSDPVYFSRLSVYKLSPPTTRQDYDESNLFIQFRLRMKEQIENPEERTWESFVIALDLYNQYKDLGYSNEEWTRLGFPIRKPTSEQWFG